MKMLMQVLSFSTPFCRCMAAPLSFEFEKTVSGSHLIGKSELSAGKVHFSECLFERSASSLSNPMPYSTTEVIIISNYFNILLSTFSFYTNSFYLVIHSKKVLIFINLFYIFCASRV